MVVREGFLEEGKLERGFGKGGPVCTLELWPFTEFALLPNWESNACLDCLRVVMGIRWIQMCGKLHVVVRPGWGLLEASWTQR